MKSVLRALTICTVIATLAACSTAGVTLDANKQPVIVALTADQTNVVFDAVKKALKDPGSAQFGDLKAAQLKDGRLQVCGLVNAKNSFGGYTGASPYEGFLAGNTFTIEVMGQDAPYAINMCKSFGVAV